MTDQSKDMALALVQRAEMIERQDDEQILASISGEIVRQYVYEFRSSNGAMTRGLSWAGVKELAQMRGNIILAEPQITDGGDHWRVMVKATDLDRNIEVWGGTHQPKAMRANGRFIDDPFAFQKAISKAQRNAVKNLIPNSIQVELVERLKALGSPNGHGQPARPLQRQQAPARPAPPVVEGEIVNEETGEIGGAPQSSPSIRNPGEFFTRCLQDFGLNQTETLQLLGLRRVQDLGPDLDDAYRRIVAAQQQPTQAGEE